MANDEECFVDATDLSKRGDDEVEVLGAGMHILDDEDAVVVAGGRSHAAVLESKIGIAAGTLAFRD